MSGVFTDDNGQQVTTGTPISIVIDNVDQRSKDYGDIKDKFRPGHADITYWEQISGSATIVAADAPRPEKRQCEGCRRRRCQKNSKPGVTITRQPSSQIGPHRIDRSRWDWE